MYYTSTDVEEMVREINKLWDKGYPDKARKLANKYRLAIKCSDNSEEEKKSLLYDLKHDSGL